MKKDNANNIINRHTTQAKNISSSDPIDYQSKYKKALKQISGVTKANNLLKQQLDKLVSMKQSQLALQLSMQQEEYQKAFQKLLEERDILQNQNQSIALERQKLSYSVKQLQEYVSQLNSQKIALQRQKQQIEKISQASQKIRHGIIKNRERTNSPNGDQNKGTSIIIDQRRQSQFSVRSRQPATSVTELMRNNHQLEEVINDLRSKIQKNEKRFQVALQSKKLQHQNSKLELKKAYQDKILKLQTENVELRQKLLDLQRKAKIYNIQSIGLQKITQQDEKLIEILHELKDQMEPMKQKLAEMQSCAHQDRQSIQRQKLNVKMKNIELNSEIEKKDDRIRQLEKKIIQLNQKLRSQNYQINQYKKLEQENRLLHGKVIVLQAQSVVLKRSDDQLQERVRQFEKRVQLLLTNKENLGTLKSVSIHQLLALKTYILQLDERLKNVLQENEFLQKNYKLYKERTSNSIKQLRKAQLTAITFETKIKGYENLIQKQQKYLEKALKGRSDELYHANEQDFSIKNKHRDQKNDNVYRENEVLREKLVLQTKCATQQVETLRLSYETKIMQIQLKLNDKDQMQKVLEKYKKQNKELHTEILKKDQQIIKLKQQINQQQQSIAILQGAKQNNIPKQQIQKLNLTIEEKNQYIKFLTNQIKQIQHMHKNKILDLQNELIIAQKCPRKGNDIITQQQLFQMQQNTKRYRKRIQQLQLQLVAYSTNKFSNFSVSNDQKIRQLNHQIASLKFELEDVKQKNNIFQDSKKKIDIKLKESIEQRQKSQLLITQLRMIIQDLEEKIKRDAQKDRTIAEYRLQIMRSSDQIDQLKARLRQKQLRNQNMEAQLEKHKIQILQFHKKNLNFISAKSILDQSQVNSSQSPFKMPIGYQEARNTHLDNIKNYDAESLLKQNYDLKAVIRNLEREIKSIDQGALSLMKKSGRWYENMQWQWKQKLLKIQQEQHEKRMRLQHQWKDKYTNLDNQWRDKQRKTQTQWITKHSKIQSQLRILEIQMNNLKNQNKNIIPSNMQSSMMQLKNKTIEKLTEQISQLSIQRNILNKNFEDSKLQIKNLKVLLESSNNAHHIKDSKQNEGNSILSHQIVFLQKTIAEKEKAIEQISKMDVERQARLNELQRVIADKEIIIQQLSKGTNKGYQKLNQFQIALTDKNATIQQLSNKMYQKQSKLNEILRAITEKQRQIELLQKTANTKQTKANEFQRMISQKENTIQEYSKANNQKQRKINELQKMLFEKDIIIQQLSKGTDQQYLKLNEFQKALTDKNSIIENLSKTVNERQTKLNEFYRTISGKDKIIQQLSSTIFVKDSKLNEFQRIIIQKDRFIEQQSKIIHVTQNKVNQIQRQLQAKDKLNESQPKNDNLNQQIALKKQSSIQKRLSDSDQIISLQQQLLKSSQTLQNLQNLNKSKDGLIQKLNQQIVKYQHQAQQIQLQYQKLKLRLSSEKSQNSETQQKKNKQLMLKLEQNEQFIGALQKQIIQLRNANSLSRLRLQEFQTIERQKNYIIDHLKSTMDQQKYLTIEELQQNNIRLRRQLDQMHIECQGLHNNLFENEQKIRALTTKNRELDNIKQDYEFEIKRLKKLVESQQVQILQHMQQKNRLKNHANLMQQESRDKIQRAQNKEKQVNKLKLKLLQMQEQINANDKTGFLKQRQNQILQLKEALMIKQSEYKLLQKKTTMNTQLQDYYQQIISKKNQQIDELKKQVDRLLSNSDYKNQIKRLKIQIAQFNDSQQSFYQELKFKQQEMKVIKQELERASKNIKQMKLNHNNQLKKQKEDRKKIQDKYEELRKKVQQANLQLNKSKQFFNQSKKQDEQRLTEQVFALEQALEKHSIKNQYLQRQIQEKESLIHQLKMNLEFEQNQNYAEKYKQYRAEIQDLRKKNEELELEVNELKNVNGELQFNISQIQNKLQMTVKFSEQDKQHYQKQTKRLFDKIQQLNQNMKKSFIFTESQISSTTKQEIIYKENKDLQQQNNKLKSQIRLMQISIQQMENSLDSTEKFINQSKNHYEETIAELKSKLAEKQSSNILSAIFQMHSKPTTENTIIDQNKNLMQKNNEMKGKISNLEIQKVNLEEKIKLIQKFAADDKAKQANQISKLSKKIQELKKQNKQIWQNAQIEIEKSQKIIVNERTQNIQLSIDVERNRIKVLQQRLKEKDDTIRSIKQQNTFKNQQIQNYQRQIKNLNEDLRIIKNQSENQKKFLQEQLKQRDKMIKFNQEKKVIINPLSISQVSQSSNLISYQDQYFRLMHSFRQQDNLIIELKDMIQKLKFEVDHLTGKLALNEKMSISDKNFYEAQLIRFEKTIRQMMQSKSQSIRGSRIVDDMRRSNLFYNQQSQKLKEVTRSLQAELNDLKAKLIVSSHDQKNRMQENLCVLMLSFAQIDALRQNLSQKQSQLKKIREQLVNYAHVHQEAFKFNQKEIDTQNQILTAQLQSINREIEITFKKFTQNSNQRQDVSSNSSQNMQRSIEQQFYSPTFKRIANQQKASYQQEERQQQDKPSSISQKYTPRYPNQPNPVFRLQSIQQQIKQVQQAQYDPNSEPIQTESIELDKNSSQLGRSCHSYSQNSHPPFFKKDEERASSIKSPGIKIQISEPVERPPSPVKIAQWRGSDSFRYIPSERASKQGEKSLEDSQKSLQQMMMVQQRKRQQETTSQRNIKN